MLMLISHPAYLRHLVSCHKHGSDFSLAGKRYSSASCADEAYQIFMQGLKVEEKKRTAAPVITATSTVQPLEKAEAPVITPLMQHIISKHEQVAKATRGTGAARSSVRGRTDTAVSQAAASNAAVAPAASARKVDKPGVASSAPAAGEPAPASKSTKTHVKAAESGTGAAKERTAGSGGKGETARPRKKASATAQPARQEPAGAQASVPLHLRTSSAAHSSRPPRSSGPQQGDFADTAEPLQQMSAMKRAQVAAARAAAAFALSMASPASAADAGQVWHCFCVPKSFRLWHHSLVIQLTFSETFHSDDLEFI